MESLDLGDLMRLDWVELEEGDHESLLDDWSLECDLQ